MHTFSKKISSLLSLMITMQSCQLVSFLFKLRTVIVRYVKGERCGPRNSRFFYTAIVILTEGRTNRKKPSIITTLSIHVVNIPISSYDEVMLCFVMISELYSLLILRYHQIST